MRKGFTIIETIMYLGFIAVILLISLPITNRYKEIMNKRQLEYATKVVVGFINGGSSYARNNVEVATVLWMYKDKIQIKGNVQKIEEFKLPSSVKLQLPYDREVDKVMISSTGHIDRAMTITLKHEDGESRYITIKVGTAYVSEKK